jgi:hypothetical protein
MLSVILTIILTSAFFILFFEPKFDLKNKTEQEDTKEAPSTSKGFVEDTRDAFIIPLYPSQMMVRDVKGDISTKYGDIGTFVGYSGVSEYDWLHGFPHEKAQ